MGLCGVPQNYLSVHRICRGEAKAGVSDKKKAALVFFLGVYMVVSALGTIYRLSRRELSLCWSLSPLLIQQICVSTARGGIVVDSKAVKESTARGVFDVV